MSGTGRPELTYAARSLGVLRLKSRYGAQLELGRALDAAGQVYMFGGGTHQQFDVGDARVNTIYCGDRVR